VRWPEPSEVRRWTWARATVLLAATADDLDRLCAAAARVRDGGLRAAGREGVVTYSPKVLIPVTTLCRDRCHSCTFVEMPGQLRRAGHGMFLSPDEICSAPRAPASFGQPIGSFQHNRFLLAEMATEVHIATILVCSSVVHHFAIEASEVSTSPAFSLDRVVQVFGGYGYMTEYPIAKAFVDSRIQTIYGGTTEIQKEIIGRMLGL
jgi:hypothetical protein